VLQWAVSQGCPWDPAYCLVEQTAPGSRQTRAWIREQMREMAQ